MNKYDTSGAMCLYFCPPLSCTWCIYIEDDIQQVTVEYAGHPTRASPFALIHFKQGEGPLLFY